MRAFPTAACAVIVAFALAACAATSSPGKVTHSPSATTHSPSATKPEQLTVSQAREIFGRFLPQFEQIANQPSLAARLSTEPETEALLLLNGAGGFPVGTLSDERFLVPALASYPRWFAVAGTGDSGHGFLFVLVQTSSGVPWREAAELYDLSSPPQIMSALTFEGARSSSIVTPTTSDEADLAVTPGTLPAEYATYVNDNGNGPDRKYFAAGGYTTSIASTNRQIAAGAPATGWRFTDNQAATTFPTYGFQLGNSSAFVVFYTKDTESWTALSPSARISTSTTSGLPYSPPAFVLSTLGIKHARAGLRVTGTAIDENLAWVAPFDEGNVTVIVNDGKAIEFAKGQA